MCQKHGRELGVSSISDQHRKLVRQSVTRSIPAKRQKRVRRVQALGAYLLCDRSNAATRQTQGSYGQTAWQISSGKQCI